MRPVCDAAELAIDAIEVREDHEADGQSAERPACRGESAWARASPRSRRTRASRRSIWPLIGFVIVAQQVQNSVENQNAHFVIERYGQSGAHCGGRRRERWRCRQDTMPPAQGDSKTTFLVGHASGAVLRVVLRRSIAETKAHRWPILAAIGAIPARHFGVGHEANRNRARPERAGARCARARKRFKSADGMRTRRWRFTIMEVADHRDWLACGRHADVCASFAKRLLCAGGAPRRIRHRL